MQLLALLIELVSIRIAGKQIKKPVDIPRPGKKGKGRLRHPDDPRAPRESAEPSRRVQPTPGGDPYKQGISVLRQTAKVRR